MLSEFVFNVVVDSFVDTFFLLLLVHYVVRVCFSCWCGYFHWHLFSSSISSLRCQNFFFMLMWIFSVTPFVSVYQFTGSIKERLFIWCRCLFIMFSFPYPLCFWNVFFLFFIFCSVQRKMYFLCCYCLLTAKTCITMLSDLVYLAYVEIIFVLF